MCGYFCIGFVDFMFADKTYFNQETRKPKLNNKKLSKYVAAFHYRDEILKLF